MRVMFTPAAGAGVVCGLALFIVSVFTGRADVAVIGVVVLCSTAAALATGRAPAAPQIAVGRRDARSADTGITVPVDIAVSAPGAAAVVLRIVEREHRTTFALVEAPHADLHRSVHTVHSGMQLLLAVEATALGADGLWAAATSPTRELPTVIEPLARALPYLPLPSSPARLTGGHDAPRPGDGGEFRDIHPFVVGDRLRRVDWKATARLARRPGDLFVRRTMATSDIDVALILDDADDITGAPGDWASGDRRRHLPTSLDVAREAAWSLACAYVDAGDQVSFQVLSRLGGAVPRGSGARHRERLRAVIASVTPQPRRLRTRTPLVAAGCVVVLLSTLLDEEPLRLAALWRAGGHRVVVVDTLPQRRSERLRREERAAARIVLGERDDRIVRLRVVGADVLVWSGDAGTRLAALRSMSRRRRA